jgi:hypothetical protein
VGDGPLVERGCAGVGQGSENVQWRPPVSVLIGLLRSQILPPCSF